MTDLGTVIASGGIIISVNYALLSPIKLLQGNAP